MSDPARITIAGLGAGAPGDITLGAWKALKSSSCILLRTGRHPVVEWLRQEGIAFTTFDALYEEAAGFQEVYTRIAGAVLREALRRPVLYAVPGHPLVAEESVRLILGRAKQEGLQVELLPAVSFLDAVFSALRLDPGGGLQVLDGLSLQERSPLPSRPAVIAQVYSRLAASEVKLTLLELYPPEHPVTVIKAAGTPGEERIETHPLFEIDRLDWIDHLTSLFLPEIAGNEPGGAEDGGRAGETGDCSRFSGLAEMPDPGDPPDRGKTDAGVCGGGNGGGFPGEQGGAGDESRAAESSELNQRPGTCRYPLDPLVKIMARLRGGDGCPWDREQDHRSLRPYLLEESYEVLEALDEGDMYKICEELGDLLLQVVFHAQIAAEERSFDLNDVVAGISEKLIRRHPHVFGSLTASNSRDVVVLWDRIKAKEREGAPVKSLLAGVPKSLPALTRAARLQKKAAGAGFDWPDYHGAMDKVREELAELEAAAAGKEPLRIEEETGDLLFSAVNLARLLGVEPEVALSGTSAKFIRRFEYVEKMARLAGRDLGQCTLAQLDKWWEEAKDLERI
jgi:tetrapyrrole methylase family protein/MazG family protein